MKLTRIIFATLLGLSIFSSCKKKDDDNSSSVSSATQGQWTVVYDYNDGRREYTRQKDVVNNSKVVKPTDPTKEEYDFVAWYRDEVCLVQWNFSIDTVTSNITLYAGWEKRIDTSTYNITWPTEVGYSLTFTTAKPTSAVANSVITFKVVVDDDYEGAPIVKANDVKITASSGNYSFTIITHTTITVAGITKIDDGGDPDNPIPEYRLQVNGVPKDDLFTINNEGNPPEGTIAELKYATTLKVQDAVNIIDKKNHVYQCWENTFPDRDFVAKAVGTYTFYLKLSEAGVLVYIDMPEQPFVPNNEYYKIYFTLPDWDPTPTNPRVWYWGNFPGLDGSNFWNVGGTSNMTKESGSTYYIEIDTARYISGLIIIFDQSDGIKQSLDIKTNIPRAAGSYQINFLGEWEGEKFKADITARA